MFCTECSQPVPCSFFTHLLTLFLCGRQHADLFGQGAESEAWEDQPESFQDDESMQCAETLLVFQSQNERDVMLDGGTPPRLILPRKSNLLGPLSPGVSVPKRKVSLKTHGLSCFVNPRDIVWSRLLLSWWQSNMYISDSSIH
jgi:hypothetical protein